MGEDVKPRGGGEEAAGKIESAIEGKILGEEKRQGMVIHGTM